MHKRIAHPVVPAAALLVALAIFSGSAAAQDKPSAPSPAVANVGLGDILAPKAFRAAAAKVMPSLVTIEAFGGLSSVKRGQAAGVRLPGEGPTSGVIISKDGYIVTSTFNFVKKPPIITVVLPDGQRKVAKLLGSDETRKLCVLKVEGVDNLPVPEFVDRGQLRVGQWAVAIGVGFGDDEPALTAGIISATSRIQGRAVQTDANLSPANYGGPLFDLEGRVIGICVPLNPQSKEVASGIEWYDSGIGFAVPLYGADALLAKLKAGENIKPGMIGIQAQPTPDKSPGAIIAAVVKDSPAEKAGLKPKDKILQIDGEAVQDATHLSVLIGRHSAGEEVKLHIQRGEEELDIVATLAVAPDKPPTPPMPRPGVRPGVPPVPMPKPEDQPKDDKPKEEKPADEKPAEPETPPPM